MSIGSEKSFFVLWQATYDFVYVFAILVGDVAVVLVGRDLRRGRVPLLRVLVGSSCY